MSQIRPTSMRYCLRTLMILLAVLPPLLAVAWWIIEPDPFGAVGAFGVAMVLALVPVAFLVGLHLTNLTLSRHQYTIGTILATLASSRFAGCHFGNTTTWAFFHKLVEADSRG